jgi:hypothetical protein
MSQDEPWAKKNECSEEENEMWVRMRGWCCALRRAWVLAGHGSTCLNQPHSQKAEVGGSKLACTIQRNTAKKKEQEEKGEKRKKKKEEEEEEGG